MELTGEQISAMAVGCREVVEEGGAWHFRRYSEELAAAYRHHEPYRVRMACPAGVRLRCRSNTSSVRLGLRYGDAARPFYRGVMLADGVAHAFGSTEPAEAWEGAIHLDLPRERLLDIWLPHLVRADLRYLAVDDGCTLTPAPLPRRWLAYGDSITQGMTVQLPTSSFVARCALALDAEVRNVAFGGARLDAILAQVDQGDYDVASIAYGTNDFANNVPLETYAANARALLAHLTAAAPGRPVLLLTVIPWAERTTSNDAGLMLEDYRAALRPIAAEVPECRLVEGPDLIADDTALFVDNVHPNDAGMAMYADNMRAALQDALAATAGRRKEGTHV